jgi:putative MATE family efflux protein
MNDAVKARSEQRRTFMLEGNLIKVIFVTALPQVVTMLIDSLYNLADTFFVSSIGDAAIAAVGVNDSLMMLIRAVSIGFGMGASSYISRSLGAKKDDEASRAATTTVLTAMGFVAVIAALGEMFILPLVNFLGATDTVRPYSMEYARWILVSAPITAATVCLAQTLRAEGSTVYSMIGSVSGCVINVILDPIFITVMGMGVAGAAIATGISKVVSAVILLMPFIRRQTVISIRFRNFAPSKALYGEIARMGIPTMLRTGMMSIATILTNNIAAGFGDVALASLSVANKSIRFVSSAVMGFGQGFQPIAGYSYGAKKYGRVLKGYRYTLTIGAIIGVTLGSLLSVFASNVIQIFSSDPAILEIGMIFIRTQAIVLPLHVSVMVSNGFFMALGKPVKAALMGLSRQIISLIPSVVVLSWLFGIYGLACAQAAADVIAFTMAVILVVPTLRELRALQKEQQTQAAAIPEVA